MKPDATSGIIIQQLEENATVRWSCRQGEYVLWVGTDSLLSVDRLSSWSIRDFWELRDGDYLTITNRMADLPPWFELNPLEVAATATPEMMKCLAAGYKTKEVMDAPNLWRVKAGNRLVWVALADSTAPVKTLLDLKRCALVLGENSRPTSDGVPAFGAPEGKILPLAAERAMRAGFDAAVALGVPREFALEWRFGA